VDINWAQKVWRLECGHVAELRLHEPRLSRADSREFVSIY